MFCNDVDTADSCIDEISCAPGQVLSMNSYRQHFGTDRKDWLNLLENYEKQDKKYGFVEFYTMYKNCNRMSENSFF